MGGAWYKKGRTRRRGTFFLSIFFSQPNSRATKRARPQASEARPSASLRPEKIAERATAIFFY